MFDRVGAKRLQPDDEAGRVRPGIHGKWRTGRCQRAAEGVGEVADECEMRHLLEHNGHDRLAPAAHRLALGIAPPRLDPFQAERCVEVAAHQVMLDLRRLM